MFGTSIAAIFIMAMLIGLIPAAIAKSKGRSFGAWWIYGTLLWIVALPHSLVVTPAPASGFDKVCPECAERVRTEAKVCRYCGYRFTEQDLEESRNEVESILQRARERDRKHKIAQAVLVSVPVVFVLIMSVGGYFQDENSQGEGAASSSQSNYNSLRQTAIQPTPSAAPYPSTTTERNTSSQSWQSQTEQPTPPIYATDPRYPSGNIPPTPTLPGQQQASIGSPTIPDSEDYSRVFKPNEVTRKAQILDRPEPLYTEEARHNQTTGSIRVQMILSATGEVSDVTAITSLPDGLTEKAVEAAKRIKFTPAEKNGHKVSQSATIDYTFNIY